MYCLNMIRSRSSSPPISPPPLRRAGHTVPRRGATNEQRKALRIWWNNDSFGARKHKDAREWWQQKYGWQLPLSTISDFLSEKYAYLDDSNLTRHQLIVKRNRKPHWETLEAALIEWQIRYDKHPDSGSTTGDLLRYKATEFWQKLPEYTGKDCPKWTDGWLAGFKKRHSMKEQRRHGEAGSAQLDADTVRIIEEIRKECTNYTADCVYNMDETGYYWKLKPDRSLSTFQEHGRKKDKARITVALTTNATGKWLLFE